MLTVVGRWRENPTHEKRDYPYGVLVGFVCFNIEVRLAFLYFV